MTRIGLVDDHAVVRAGYRRLIELEDELAVAAEFTDAESAYAAVTRPGAEALDVLVVDLSLPGVGGLELLRRLALRPGSPRVLVFSMHDGPATVRQCLAAGAAGFVTKSSAPEVLVAALHELARGGRYVSADVAAALAQAAPAHAALSVREFDILRHLVAGRGVDDIARTLHLSAKTVANYQTEIRRKLGAHTAVELLRYAADHGVQAADH